jgi:hypothetical protein
MPEENYTEGTGGVTEVTEEITKAVYALTRTGALTLWSLCNL